MGGYMFGRGGNPSDQWFKAIEVDFAKAIELDPEEAIVYVERGKVRMNLGMYLANRGDDPTDQWRKAIEEDFLKAIEMDPSNLDAWAYRGETAGAWGRYLKFCGNETEAVGQFVRADDWLTRAIELNAKDARARWQRGSIRLDAGRAADALTDFEAAIKLNPALEKTLRAYIKRAQKEFEY